MAAPPSCRCAESASSCAGGWSARLKLSGEDEALLDEAFYSKQSPIFEIFSLYYWNGYLVTLLAEGWSSKDATVLVRGL